MQEMLQSLHHLCGPLLDSLKYGDVSLVLGSLELVTLLLELWSYQGWVEGKDHLPQPAGSTAASAAQDAINQGCLAWHIQMYLCLIWMWMCEIRLWMSLKWHLILVFLIEISLALLYRSDQMTAQPISALSYVKTCYVSSSKSVMTVGIANEIRSNPIKELWAFMCLLV